MKRMKHTHWLSLLILLLTVATGECLAAERPRALVLAWNDAGATATALRNADLNVIQSPQLPLSALSGPLVLDDVRLVVLSADQPLPEDLAAQVATFVRAGGGLLVLHTSDDPDYWWNTYRQTGKGPPDPSPLWDALPFVSIPMADQRIQGIRNPFGPTRVLRQIDSPLLDGVDLTQAPAFPYHGFMVLPTHTLVQNAHVMFAWSEDQYKSPLWGNGAVLAWGDDPQQRPLLLRAEYGAGRAVAAAVPLFDEAFLAWPGSQVLLGNLTAWLADQPQPTVPATVSENRMPENKVYGVGLPWIVSDSLKHMGLAVTEQPAGATGAIVYGEPTAEQARAVAQLARENKPVVVANPTALRVAPLSELVSLGRAVSTGSTSNSANASPASTPRTVVDAMPLWNKRDMLRDRAWAVNPNNGGEAAVHWQDGIVGPNSGELQGPSVADADALKLVASWSKTYRWRLEGSLLDRRDLIEAWDRSEYDDSAWEEQPFGQSPPSPNLLGQQTPAQNLLAGAVWARARLTLTHPETSRGWLVPSSAPKFVTLLDGKTLREPVALRALAEGEHVVALRAWPLQQVSSMANENPWGRKAEELQWPEIVVDSPRLHHANDKGEAGEFALEPLEKFCFRATVRLPVGAKFKGGKGSLPAELLGRDATYHLCSLIQPERLLGYYVVTTLERTAEDKLDDMAIDFRSKPDTQSVVALSHMLRNYGALWGGVLAPDRVDKLMPGEGALYLMPSGAGEAEAESLVDLVRRGGCASIFFSTGGTKTQETALSDLFGVKYAPLAADVAGGIVLTPEKTERPSPLPTCGLPQYIATRPGKDDIQGIGGLSDRAMLRSVEAGQGRAIFSALNGDLNWGWDHDLARQLAKAVNWAAGNPVTLPEGVGGYAFEAKGMTFLVLEELKYTGGPAAIHVKLPAGNYLAADLFSGQPVKVESRGDGILLRPTLLPNGGNLVVVRKIE